MFEKNSQRNQSYKENSSVDDEVKKLFRKPGDKVKSSDFLKLSDKYDDDVATDIKEEYLKKQHSIAKKAKKLVKDIKTKYGNNKYPFHVLLEYAKKIKKKKNYSDDEFDEFKRIFEQELIGLKSPDVLHLDTNIMKTLGSVNIEYNGFNTKLNDVDYKHLQSILAIHASSKALHSLIVKQSVQYEDFQIDAMNGSFIRALGHKAGDCVHPVIAALFLPKIDVLDSHFLIGNISNIIKSRYNNEPLEHRSDFELFDRLTKDPNDIVCNSQSSLLDLLTRVQVQNSLWNNVYSLRSGQYYNQSFRDFITSIDMCKLNKYDNPNLIYGTYDGTLLKRLLSIFSFRPTVVATLPMHSIYQLNPYQHNIRPVVINVPMINFRLPVNINDNSPLDLTDALTQTQTFVENGIMISKQTNIIYSRGVLFFFIDRRSHVIRYNEIEAFSIARLPVAVSGFERLNDRPVDFELEFSIGDDLYRLKSVVAAEINNMTPEKNLVIGSSAMFVIHQNLDRRILTNEYLLYDPINVSDGYVDPTTNQLESRQPITSIPYNEAVGMQDVESFYVKASTTGIIFMYELIKDATTGNIIM